MEFELPRHFNWQHQETLPLPCRRQGKCSCCWAMVPADLVAFKTIQTYAIPDARAFIAAVQELVDQMPIKYPKYLTKVDEVGCQPSNIFWAFKYIKHFGIGLQRSYRYVGARQFGKAIPEGPRIRLKELVCLENASEIEIKGAIWRQPIAGRIKAYKSFRKWKGTTEIYRRHVKQLNETGPGKKKTRGHALIITGYGIDHLNGMLFYHVRSSWGRRWGDQGYARVYSNLVKATWYVKSVEYTQ